MNLNNSFGGFIALNIIVFIFYMVLYFIILGFISSRFYAMLFVKYKYYI